MSLLVQMNLFRKVNLSLSLSLEMIISLILMLKLSVDLRSCRLEDSLSKFNESGSYFDEIQ